MKGYGRGQNQSPKNQKMKAQEATIWRDAKKAKMKA